MSVNADETQGPEVVELPMGDAAFGSLMDALVPDEETSPSGGDSAGGEAPAGDPGSGAAGPAGGAGVQEGAAPNAGPAGAEDGASAATGPTGDPGPDADAGGAAGADPGASAGAAPVGGGAAAPDSWTADATEYSTKLGDLSNALEERTVRSFQEAAFEEVREEHGKYLDAINLHPYRLQGQKVPSLHGEGEVTLRSSEEAREWQEAVKSILAEEINARASKQLDENRDFLTTVHQSIDLFKSNMDLIPGTKQFDVELANRFATVAKPYELRVEGKLQGYSIPVQPLIEQLRTEIKAQRAAAPAPASAPAKTSAPAKPVEKPQAGISSKAGQSGEGEDFSTLFGTLGLPNLRI